MLPAALLALAAAAPDLRFAAGRAMTDAYFRGQVKQIADNCLADLTTKADWERRRPELRRQFLDMMGLWPLPPRTDLHATVTGTAEGQGFVVERLHYQSRPGLYVTANLYRPKTAAGKLPAVLYVCGHGNVVENGVSFGSKVSYQYHPAWFAAHGYVCLVLDTLQLGEIPGEHHGTYRLGQWWWQARGYTPGGVELWNAVRGLDYLQSRPDVDPERLGVTGRSGGGATSWWVAAADDRVKAIAPVAGIVDLESHVCEGQTDRLRRGVIAGHCDCMYMVNSYRWDFPLVAALAAPRPLLLGNSDADDIFPVAGYHRLADKVRKVYALYGAEEKFLLLETKGPHVDTPELRNGINRWMNRWLKGDATTAVEDELPPKLAPRELKVLAKVPEGAVNGAVAETFVKPAAAEEVPAAPAVAAAWWANRKPELLAALKEKVFAGWPKNPPPLAVSRPREAASGGVRLRAVSFTSEAHVPLTLWVLDAENTPPSEVVLSVLDEQGWDEWCRDLPPEFAEVLGRRVTSHDTVKFAQNRQAVRSGKFAFAAVCPRGIGPTAWAVPGSADDTHTRRRFPLVGQTLDGQRVWDTRRAVAAVGEIFPKVPLRLHGERAAAGIALYAGLFEPGVSAFDLWHMTASHRDGPVLLNVLTVLDVPQAVSLASPRPVNLFVKDETDRAAWDWPVRLQAAVGGKSLRVATGE